MKQRFTKLLGAIFSLLLVPSLAVAEWHDFEIELRGEGLLTADEVSTNANVSFGIAVDGLGNVTRVATDAPTAVAVIYGKAGNDHGLQNFSCVVPVEGDVEITTSTCSWGGTVTVKDGGDATVSTFTTQKGEGGSGCYVGGKSSSANIISVKYLGTATTLTISGGGYIGYFAMKAVSASAADVSFSLGGAVCEGTALPAGGTYAIDDSYIIPTNHTLYKEGYTLTGWTDGVNTYAVGSSTTLTGDLALTPVFTLNSATLDDRTTATTVRWEFRKNQGVPLVAWEGNSGFLVGQANVNGTNIDVKMTIDATSGKFNNSNGDWAQVNATTYFTMPICKNASFVTSTMSASEKGTFDGVEGGTNNGYNLEYTYTGEGTSMVVGLGAASWYKYIDVTYPIPTAAVSTKADRNYATYVTTSKLDFASAEGVTAYIATGLNGAQDAVVLSPVDIVPAGTPIIVKTETQGATVNVPVTTADASDVSGNKLVAGDGTTAWNGTDGYKYYFLKQDQFHEATSGTLQSGKAYLKVAASTGAPALSIDFGATNISTTNFTNDTNNSGEYFNLAGQRVAQPTKGLYIVNGKKVIVK